MSGVDLASTAATAVQTPPRRQSEPNVWNPYTVAGPAGVLPRRGRDPIEFMTSEQLRELTVLNPFRLVRELARLHPSVDMALDTALRLMCPTENYQVVAEAPDSATGGVSADAEEADTDTDGTASLAAMFAQLPPEVGGGLRGLRTILALEAIMTGMPIAEACPGQPLEGVKRIWPMDSLTCGFWRPTRDADLVLRQRLKYPQQAPPDASGGTAFHKTGGNWAWQDMPAATVFWRAVGQEADDPYGRAPYAAAMMEVIADLALMQDLRDAVHNAAWPRHEIGVNLTELHKTAVEVYRITDAKRASEWVTARFQEVVDYVASLRPDDNVVHDSAGTVKMLQPGSFVGVEGVLSFLRQRIAQSLKTLPTLLGINDGSTFNYTSVEWAVYAQGLETLSAVVDEIIIEIANLHLRLIGSKSKAKVIKAKIRTNDAQVDANTESTKITNATNKEKLGYLTHDQAAMSITGRKAASEAQPGVIEPLPEPEPGAGNSTASTIRGTRKQGQPGPKKLPQNPNSGGTTKEDRDAEKSRPK